MAGKLGVARERFTVESGSMQRLSCGGEIVGRLDKPPHVKSGGGGPGWDLAGNAPAARFAAGAALGGLLPSETSIKSLEREREASDSALRIIPSSSGTQRISIPPSW